MHWVTWSDAKCIPSDYVICAAADSVSASESGTDGGDDDSVAASKQEEQPRRRQVHWEKYANYVNLTSV